LRDTGDKIFLAYKHHQKAAVDGAIEVEVEISDIEKTKILLEYAGIIAVRWQEKIRHTYLLDNVVIDIDTWPTVPAYVELEGDSEEELKTVASRLKLDWKNVELLDAKSLLAKYYKISVTNLKFFTFGKIE
jgi:adenylate cyclase, class 2